MGRLHEGGWLAALAALALAVGCPTEEPDDDDDAAGTVDLSADTDQSGTVDGSDAEDAAETDAPGAVALVNVDDDNSDGSLDCDAACAEENDLAEGALDCVDPVEGDSLLPILDGDVDQVRIMLGDEPILGMVEIGGDAVTEVEIDEPEAADLWFEGLDFHFEATLIAELYDADGELVSDDELLLSTPPFMMFTHLDPAETLYVMSQNVYNAQMRNGLKEAVGEENVVEFPVNQYGWDVWIQDEMEFGYQQTPYGPMQLVLDSVRNGTLDPLPEDEMVGPDFGWLTRDDVAGQFAVSSLDSFGNLECTPPITVDGVEYPFGRIYYGCKDTVGGDCVIEDLQDFLDAQEVQSPVKLDSTWLIVGHVDEFMVFVPDASSDKGFKVLMSDWGVTRDLLESLDPNFAIPRFEDDHHFLTVGEILESTVIQYNEDTDALHLQPMHDSIKEQFGLTDDDILLIPALWEKVWGAALALNPGMANLAVYNNELLIADPFFRTPDEDVNGDGQLNSGEDLNGDGLLDTDEDANGNGELDEGEDINGNGVLDTEEDLNGNWLLDEGEDLNGNGLLNTFRDPFQLAFLDVMPDGLTANFLDNWEGYHLWWGEVHCGTNILREPRSDLYWWELGE